MDQLDDKTNANGEVNTRTAVLLPPRFATRLLLVFLKPSLVEEVTGDLDERFQQDIRRHSLGRARLGYWFQVIQYLRPFAIRGINCEHIISNAMFKNYWKITWRVMGRQKMYSAINIGGFAIGITACLLITLYVRHELSYDKHYANRDNIYRIYRQSHFLGQFNTDAWLPAPMADALLQFPEIEQSGHYVSASGLVDGRSEIKRADRNENFVEDNIVYANQGLVDVLEFSFISGNAAKSLNDPNTVVITKSKADKYFAGEDPLGKALVLNNDEKNPYKITGVIRDHPTNTHFRADFILSLKGHEFWPGESTAWGNSNYFDYVSVRPGISKGELEKKLHVLIAQYFIPDAIKDGNDASVDWAKSLNFRLQPIADVHFNLAMVRDTVTHADIRHIWLFGAIAFFVIVIASINFVNLSTARSANRAKEVGLRKVVGSLRGSLIRQFLIESIVYCMVALLIACGLALALMPAFNEVMGTSLTFWSQPWTMMPSLFLIALVIAVVAGLYPAFYLSSFRPAEILRGKVRNGLSHSRLRGALVVCQYTISIALIIGTLTVKRQMSYMMTKQLGFDKDQVLVIQNTHTLSKSIATFKNELQQTPGVENVSVSGFLPVEGTRRNGSGMWKDTKGLTADGVDVQQWTVDDDYLQTLGLKLLDGRNFSIELASDSQAIVVNQKLVKAMGIPHPIGQVIVNPWQHFTIVGVVEDFHFETMHKDIAPVALMLGKNEGAISIKLNTTDIPSTIAGISALWKRYIPDQPIRYTFLDQSYARMYDDVQRMGTLVTGFAVLAIIVASLGLFALSAFTVEQRTKEISIRMVLGATTASIVNLLTGNFMKLVVISFVIAAPLAWYLMNHWLQDYAYRVTLKWDLFFIASMIALVIALGTTSLQAAKAALTNPARNLRSE
ncbi:MAG TPA: ABC transporter permease [Chryseolinea sp.]|nr:ABC transporter permease [Chryseolinea sp.]